MSQEVLKNYYMFRKINLIHATGLFLYPLKTSVNHGFSDVSRGYRKRPVAWNGLRSRVYRLSSMKIVFERTVRQIKYFDTLQHCKMQKQAIFTWHRKTSSAHLHQIQCSLLVWLLFVYSVNSFMTEVSIIKKPFHWFALHERVKANSIWRHWSLSIPSENFRGNRKWPVAWNWLITPYPQSREVFLQETSWDHFLSHKEWRMSWRPLFMPPENTRKPKVFLIFSGGKQNVSLMVFETLQRSFENTFVPKLFSQIGLCANV